MEHVYCMQNAFSPIVFSEESDTGNRDYVEHSLVAFLGDPSKSLSRPHGAADDDEGERHGRPV